MNELENKGELPSPEDLFALFRAVDEAFRGEDIEALKTALGNPEGFPNTPLPPALDMGDNILHYAIFFSPLVLIQQLITAGVNLKHEGVEQTPPLFSAILSERDDRITIMQSLLEHGADIIQMGYNDWAPLHLAVNAQDLDAISFLVSNGADPYWRAGDDDADTSAFDDALAMEFDEGVEAMLNGGEQA